MMETTREHWERVYSEKEPDAVSWYQSVPEPSLVLIDALGLPAEAPIIDVGGGTSRLGIELIARGHNDVTVADISAEALARARAEAGEAEGRIEWVVADVRDHDFGRRFALWHDRAVFHFMVSAADRQAYLATLERSLEPGGRILIATFGPEGPTRCSGLPTARYSAEELAATIGAELVGSRLVEHRTPGGNTQQFLFADLRRATA